MTTPSSPTEGLWLPAERARRCGVYLGMVLAWVLNLVILELLAAIVGAVLIAGGDPESVFSLGVAGYLGIPGFGVVITLPPLFVLMRRRSGLRIDATGISKVWASRTETVPWADIDSVRFNDRGCYLMLQLKPGALPGKPFAAAGPRVVLIHSLGGSLWRLRRPAHPGLIVDALDRFAPGKYTEVPWNVGRGGA